ncbi:MAG: DUF4175 family protein [Rubripirellula sp.]
MNAPAVSFNVAKRFHELRRRYLSVRIGIAFAVAVAALISVWLVLASCDYVWEWSLLSRKTAMLIGSVSVGAWLVSRLYLIVRDTRQRKFAAQLEAEFEEFGQRIRTVLDTVDGRVEGPDEMLTALGHQTLGRWETLTPAQMVPARSLVVAGIAAIGGLVLSAVLFFAGSDMSTAMKRVLGQPIPYTKLTVAPGDSKVLEGAPMSVSLQLTGRTDRDVTLRYRHLLLLEDLVDVADVPEGEVAEEKIEWVESELLPAEPKEGETVDPRKALFAAGLGKAKEPIEYQFVTSVGETPIFRMDVQPLIEADRIEMQVQPPAYTRLEGRSFASSSVTVLERSTVTVTIQTNHPLKNATLATGKKPSTLEPVEVVAGDDRSQWTFELPSTQSLHWKFSGKGSDGTPMIPVKGRLRVRYDTAPSLTWRDPPDQIKVHTLAEIPMRVQVADDYGLTESGIVFQLGDDDEYVLADWTPVSEEEADGDELASAVTTRVRLEEILPLESLALSERDYISYYAYAVDNRESGQHRSESDVRYIDIRPLRQFYSEFEQDPMQGGAGRVIVQLGEIIRRQRFLVNRTRRLLRSSSSDLAKQLGTIDRMVESQSELAGLTRFLAEFFVSRGNDDVEALNQAEAAMLQAADSLAAGSFDLALVQEEDALRALAEARRTLEIALLKNPTPQQQAALRRLARQLRQKLRREPPETEQQIADTLQRIAAEQAQLGQSAMRLSQRQASMKSQVMGMGKGGKPNPASPNGGGAGGGGQPSDPDSKSAENQTPDDSDSAQKQTPDGPSSAESDAEAKPNAGDPNEPGENEKPGEEGEKGEDPEAKDESEAAGGGEEADDEPSIEEAQNELYARQVDLLERIQEIEEQLAERLSTSSLMAERMQEAKSSMDGLAGAARKGDLNELARDSKDTADQLRELGIQLDAMAATEPVSRVSSIRDLSTSLANMERELSAQLRAANGESQQEPQDSPATGSRGSGMSQLARRMQRRAETVEDILKTPVEVGDVETSEVNDQLRQFVEDNEFLEQLSETKAAVEKMSDEAADSESKTGEPQGDSEDESEQAFQRAVDYASASRMLDELYRQLVTPRLNRLRRMEQKANQLANQMKGQGKGGEKAEQQKPSGGGGQQEEEDENPDTKAGMRMLADQLEEEGMKELAELLSEGEVSDEEIKKQLEMQFGPNGDGNVGGSRTNFQSGRLSLVIAELQARIQEMILLEISADRDAPVPAKYRRAVDGYFRSLAGDADVVDMKSMSGASGGSN